jgi:O-antigen ligase
MNTNDLNVNSLATVAKGSSINVAGVSDISSPLSSVLPVFVPTLRRNLDTLALILAIIAITFIPLHHTVVNILFPASICCTILAGNWRYKWQVINGRRLLIGGGVILLGLFAAGLVHQLVYQLVPMRYALIGLFKYAKIIYLVFLLPLFTLPQWRKYAVHAMFLGVFINVIAALLQTWKVSVFGSPDITIGGYFVHPLYTSVLIAFAAFMAANYFLDQQKYKWVYGALFLLYSYTLFFVYIERTGYLIFFCLLLLGCWQRWRWRGLLASFVAASLLGGALYKFSPVFGARVVEGINNFKLYHAEKDHGTSWGYRLVFVRYSMKLIEQHPLIGNGTGSFSVLYSKSGGPPLNEGELLGHPHNEYILIAVQLGLVGLLVFLAWLAIQWRESLRLPLLEQRAVQGLIATFVINGFCNASLYVNTTGVLYIVFLSIFFAAGCITPVPVKVATST